MRHGKKVDENPWQATTLEWSAPSPPPHGNFVGAPVVYRGPYEYSLPGRSKDYTMQTEPIQPDERRFPEPALSLGH
jgi:cytochrome c oxidase subunit 1